MAKEKIRDLTPEALGNLIIASHAKMRDLWDVSYFNIEDAVDALYSSGKAKKRRSERCALTEQVWRFMQERHREISPGVVRFSMVGTPEFNPGIPEAKVVYDSFSPTS